MFVSYKKGYHKTAHKMNGVNGLITVLDKDVVVNKACTIMNISFVD